ncbi:hypothetical protein FAZ95_04215 [Trinickia violacea]|uniref:Uncharacterized protein n=1 Tax=Trinickia violacea TaxID=2571746 RepID=A0A4P8IKT5_9BURK|nr:hypothetical protein [Trinickia violacea]QCP48461.1 hypothetical protein FAZ95_04215 [Trinickia violacea]
MSSVSGGGYAAAGVLAASNDKGAEVDSVTRAERVLAELNRDDNGYIKISALTILVMLSLWGISMLLSLSWLLLLVGQSGPLVMEMFPIHHAIDRYVPGVGCLGFLLVVIYQLVASRVRKRASPDGQVWFFLAMIFGAIQMADLAGHLSIGHSPRALYWLTCVVAGLIWLFVGIALSLRPSHPSIVRLHGRAGYAFGFAFILSAGLIMQAFMRDLTHHAIAEGLNLLYFASLLIVLFAMVTNPNWLCLPAKIYYEGLRRKFGGGTDQAIHKVHGYERAPIHLINCFSQSPVARDDEKKQRRGGENFCVSRRYCGSASSGYFPTKEWYVGNKRKSWKHQFIWRLVATSGAAVDIHPVRQSPLRNSLLTVFNMGLGAWVINPAFNPERRTWRPSFFLNSMAALNVHNNRTKWMRLSDGGHFENLGIYELVARECMDIVVVDAGHDPNYEFSDLAYAIDRCREDFEAVIDVPNLFPRETQNRIQEVNLTGTIRYKGKTELGKITYIKLGVEKWHSLPLRLRSSIDRHFPHEPTTNQFPTRDFINAYYRLGVETASRALPVVISEQASVDVAVA